MNKETKITMLGWIEETFVSSNDLFEYSPYNIKHWMEEEIGVYVSEYEFVNALEESEFKNDGKFFYIKLSPDAGPVAINKIYPLSNMSWDEDKKEGTRKRLQFARDNHVQ